MNQQRWAVIAAVLVLAAIVGGIAYNIGVSQGIAQSGKIVAAPGGPYPYPYYGWHPWGFGFFLFPLFFFAFSIHAEARAKRLIIRVIDTGNGRPRLSRLRPRPGHRAHARPRAWWRHSRRQRCREGNDGHGFAAGVSTAITGAA